MKSIVDKGFNFENKVSRVLILSTWNKINLTNFQSLAWWSLVDKNSAIAARQMTVNDTLNNRAKLMRVEQVGDVRVVIRQVHYEQLNCGKYTIPAEVDIV